MDFSNHYLVIGGQKAGTTWLQHVFDTDSRVCTSFDQEIHYFDQNKVLDFQVYKSFFKYDFDCKASVDVTPDYMDSPYTLEHLERFRNEFEFCPKVIIILREPVQRAFSAYQMFLNYGKRLGKFEDALNQFDDLYEKGLYGKHIKRWIEAGYRDKMLVLLFDDLVHSPNDVLTELSDFMGLSSKLSDLYLGHAVNSGGINRFKAISVIRRNVGLILRKYGFHRAIHVLKRMALFKWVDEANKKKLVLDPAEVKRLKSLYSEDVDLLSSIFPGLNLKERWRYDK